MARILLIDDDALVRTTVKAMLESGGHAVVLAIDGEDAVDKFPRQPFDLVLCDVFMPNKEGLQTVRELRALAPDLPIISMTGGARSGGTLEPTLDFLRMTAELGATRTINKPFKAAELLGLVQQCLDGSAPSTGR